MDAIAQRIELEWKVATDRRVPWSARGVVLFAVSYLSWTFDFIPDDIPFFGHLDEVGIVLGGYLVARSLIPLEVIEDCRRRVKQKRMTGSSGKKPIIFLMMILLGILGTASAAPSINWPVIYKWIRVVGYMIVGADDGQLINDDDD